MLTKIATSLAILVGDKGLLETSEYVYERDRLYL